MKERPILFSGPMVRAILDGRKTQTRRVMNPQPHEVQGRMFWLRGKHAYGLPTVANKYNALLGLWSACPHGVSSERLWVREAFRHIGNTFQCSSGATTCGIVYRADNAFVNIPWTNGDPPVRAWWNTGRHPWTPPIHMPRWASRITLEIVSVRVERVQDITEADCYAEGLQSPSARSGSDVVARDNVRKWYMRLWDSINAARGYGWSVNPFVWRIEFRRVEGGAA